MKNIFDYIVYLQYHSRTGGLENKDYIMVGLVITILWYLYVSSIKSNNNTKKDLSMDNLFFVWIGATSLFFIVTEINKGLYQSRIKKYKSEGYDKEDARDHAMMDARNTRRGSLF